MSAAPTELRPVSRAEKSPPRRACVLLSGGMDSAVCLHWAIARYGRDAVLALTLNYGQRHHRELRSAWRIALAAGVELVQLDVQIPWQRSALTGGAALASPVVPGRNLIFATVAAAEVVGRGGDTVVMGCCADDAALFPDCRPEFVASLEQTLRAALGRPLVVRAPYLSGTKAHTLQAAERLGAREAVGMSWSCYAPQSAGARSPVPCGECGACVARAAAFAELGWTDPGWR